MTTKSMADERSLPSGIGGWCTRLAGLAMVGLLLAACASNRASMQPQPRQPEPARSAADGEIIGANRQAPEDTIEGSVTNEHPAPGWEVENGKLVRSTEVQNPGNQEEVQKTSGKLEQERDCIADSQREAKSAKAGKATPGGQEATPAPRALDRSLQAGCPQPPNDH
jgi:hypothetical protein